MANWIDVCSLSLTLAIIGGVIYAIIWASRQISESMNTTKENLKNRGLTISREGVSVKTSKRFDRSDYVDATQRGFIKAYGASSFGKNSMGSEGSQEPIKAKKRHSK